MEKVSDNLSDKLVPLRPFEIEEDLLSNHTKFQTADYHDAKRYIDRTNAGFFQFSMVRKNGFEKYDIRSANLGDVDFKLVRIDSKSKYDIRNKVDADVVLLHLVLRGSAEFRLGGKRLKAFPGQMVLLETNTQSSKCWNAPSQLLIIKLSRRILEQVASRDLAQGGNETLEFGGLKAVDFETVPTLWNYILTICRDLGEAEPSFDGTLAQQAERTFYLLVLKAVSNAYDRAPPLVEDDAPSAPYYIRRVEQYIRDFAKDPIDMDDLVKAGGVSSRSIYNGFKRFRASTPMAYLKTVRLDLARAELLQGSEGEAISVTDAALRVGYTNMSQFSRDYRMQFSETPSRTLRGF